VPTAVFYLKSRVATLVFYAYKCVNKPIVVRGIRLKNVERLARYGRRRDGVLILKGRYAALAVAFLDTWKRRDVGRCVDRLLAQLYKKVVVFRRDGVPDELWEIWRKGGIGAPVPREVAERTPVVYLWGKYGEWKLNEYVWADAEFIWL